MVIVDADAALRTLLASATSGNDVDITFDAPNKEWSSSRNKPALNAYLYDIGEELERRQVMYETVRDENHRIVERRQPPRRIRLSYLVSAWVKRAEDEHRLLSSVLQVLIPYDTIPQEALVGNLVGKQVFLTVALPTQEGMVSPSEVWARAGSDHKPSIPVRLSVPVDVGRTEVIARPMTKRIVDVESRPTPREPTDSPLASSGDALARESVHLTRHRPNRPG